MYNTQQDYNTDELLFLQMQFEFHKVNESLNALTKNYEDLQNYYLDDVQRANLANSYREIEMIARELLVMAQALKLELK